MRKLQKDLVQLLFLLLILIEIIPVYAQEKEYSDGHGGKVILPLGDISFADKVVSFTIGNPAPIAQNANPDSVIGPPDFNEEYAYGFLSLGGGGELVVEFTDNALVNIDGPDMYVFELGKYVEETFLFVSTNAKNWISVGKISGGKSVVDIGDSTLPGAIFRYVKLVDARTNLTAKDKNWPGADIDAIAAIGSAKQLSLNALYLFNTNESKIKEQAKKELLSIVSELKLNSNYDIVIYGHTDSLGSKNSNRKLSADRSNAVKNFMISQAPELGTKLKWKTVGFADEQPVADNKTKEGREKNRRVEIYFIPAKK